MKEGGGKEGRVSGQEGRVRREEANHNAQYLRCSNSGSRCKPLTSLLMMIGAASKFMLDTCIIVAFVHLYN